MYAAVGFLIVLGLLWAVAKPVDRFPKQSGAIFFLQEKRLSHFDFDPLDSYYPMSNSHYDGALLWVCWQGVPCRLRF